MTGEQAPGAPSLPRICPLCDSPAAPFVQIATLAYWRCPRCALTFMDPAQFLSPDAEHAHYLHHENHVEDPGYRKFLAKLATPLMARLAPGARGLDYGCGPGPALAAMLTEAGHEMAVYDPFFAPDPAPLSQVYDFVTCTEVAEHFHSPARDFARLRALVRPGGVLAVMTCFQTDDARFADWHYRKDPTHVAFYKAQTFETMAALWGWACECPAKDVVILQRPDTPA